MLQFKSLLPADHHLATRSANSLMGFIPGWLSEDDPRPAKQQIHENYIHGGGWFPFNGFTMDPETKVLTYPGDEGEPDEKTYPLAEGKLRNETLVFYEHEWLAIIQPDGSFEIARID